MATPIREMKDKELITYLEECQKELLHLRFNYAVVRSLQNPARVRLLKRNVARVLTIQRERELSAQSKASVENNTTTKKTEEKKKHTKEVNK